MKNLSAKSPLILTGLVLALGVFGATSLVWFNVTVPSPVQDVHVAVRGTESAPTVAALALVAATACLALTIAGRVLRWIVAPVILLAAVGVVVSVTNVIRDPRQATETAVGDSAGVIGVGTVPEQGVWPWVTLVMAALLAILAFRILIVLRSWNSTQNTKYQRQQREDPARQSFPEGLHDPDADRRHGIDAWDALSEGQDPTRP